MSPLKTNLERRLNAEMAEELGKAYLCHHGAILAKFALMYMQGCQFIDSYESAAEPRRDSIGRAEGDNGVRPE